MTSVAVLIKFTFSEFCVYIYGQPTEVVNIGCCVVLLFSRDWKIKEVIIIIDPLLSAISHFRNE